MTYNGFFVDLDSSNPDQKSPNRIDVIWIFLCPSPWVCLKVGYLYDRRFLVFLFPDAQNMRFSFVIHRFILIFAVE